MELKLPLDLINKILGKLGEQPYASVYPLIIEINNICLPQLPPQEELPTETVEKAEVEVVQ